jgi:hypothetical protein
MKTKFQLGFISLPFMLSTVMFGQYNGMHDRFPSADTLLKKASLAEGTPSAFSYTTNVVYQNGPASNRVNLVYASDGYTKTDLTAFAPQVEQAINYLKTASLVTRPLPRYFNFINVYRINLESKESGLSVAPAFGQSKTTVVNNALGGTHDLDRLGWVDNTLAANLYKEVENKLGVRFNWRYVILNNSGYYNSGSEVVCFSYNNCKEIALHEGGHGFFDLADEYYSTGSYSGAEPSEINVSANLATKKWTQWKGYVDEDKNCGMIGIYEGARFFSKGMYRPSDNSKMGWTKDIAPVSYNAVSREQIILDIYSIVRPMDACLDTLTQKKDPDSIWVKVIDPAVIWVDWYVNGVLVKKNGGSSLKRNEISSAPGTYTVKAHVYDEVVIHANSSNSNPHPLDLVRKDLYKLQQNAQWNVKLTIPNTIASVENHFSINFFTTDTGEFILEAENLPDERYLLEIISITGQVFYKEELNVHDLNYSKRFQLAGISPGLYMIRLSGKELLVNKKIILN